MNKRYQIQNYHWPQLKYQQQLYPTLIKQSKHTVQPQKLPKDMVHEHINVSMATVQLTLSVATRFLKKRTNAFPLQLVLLTSLMISCKYLETNPPQLNTLHKLSSNSFTNKDFYRTEMAVLVELKFDILAEGVPNRQTQLVVHCVRSLLKQEEQKIFPSIVADLERLFWVYLYTGRIKLRSKEGKAICATLIHLSLVFLTQYSGRFLQTLWACELTGASEKDVTLLGNRLLRCIVGEERGKNFKI